MYYYFSQCQVFSVTNMGFSFYNEGLATISFISVRTPLSTKHWRMVYSNCILYIAFRIGSVLAPYISSLFLWNAPLYFARFSDWLMFWEPHTRTDLEKTAFTLGAGAWKNQTWNSSSILSNHPVHECICFKWTYILFLHQFIPFELNYFIHVAYV